MNARRTFTALLMVLCNTVAWAQTTSLALTDDTHIADDAGVWLQADRNYGSRPLMLVHDWGPFYALVRFDAAAISGQNVDSATLRLYLADLRAGGTISVHAITSPWTESSVTWNTRPSFEPAAETVIEIGSADVGSIVSVDITHLVAQWASGAAQNHGLLLRTTEPVRAVFDTKETLGGVPAELEVMATTGPSVYAKVLDFTDPDSCIIDEPGYYILNRDWIIPPSTDYGPPYGCPLQIKADVTIDFQGFSIRGGDPGALGGNPVVEIASGMRVVFRNGRIGYSDDYAISAPEAWVRLDRMDISGQTLIGAGEVENCRLSGKNDVSTIQIRDSARIVNSRLYCTVPCIETGNGPAEIRGNTITGDFSPAVVIRGPDSHVIRNDIAGDILILTGANRSIIAWNTVSPSNQALGNINVEATGIVLEGNIASGNLLFDTGGNYFGNNRINGIFDGAAAQVDWGGNVSF